MNAVQVDKSHVVLNYLVEGLLIVLLQPCGVQCGLADTICLAPWMTCTVPSCLHVLVMLGVLT